MKKSKKLSEVTIYTDGGCRRNPGPGGYGVVLKNKVKRKEVLGGFRRTTNNRMEIMAAIVGLEHLKMRCSVTIYSDSKYLVNAMMKGWAKNWKRNNWKRNEKENAKNPDLWEKLLDLCMQHDVTFHWVKGHAGNRENERCDILCNIAMNRQNLPVDLGHVE